MTFAFAAGWIGCVDGVTPDCSNPVVCAPSVGSLPRDASTDTKDLPDTSGLAADTGTDAPLDAGHDGDGG